MKVFMKHSGLKDKFIFYLDQRDLSQRSFIEDHISGKRSPDHWSSCNSIQSMMYRQWLCVTTEMLAKSV